MIGAANCVPDSHLLRYRDIEVNLKDKEKALKSLKNDLEVNKCEKIRRNRQMLFNIVISIKLMKSKRSKFTDLICHALIRTVFNLII